MVMAIPRICPSIVSIRMKVLLNALNARDDAKINKLCTLFEQHMDDSNIVLFTHEETEHVQEQLTYIHVLSMVNQYEAAVQATTKLQDMCEQISSSRMGVLYLLRTIWYTPTSNDELSLGPIDDLPRLVKYEISNILEKEYNLV
jgi:hypothetical protein